MIVKTYFHSTCEKWDIFWKDSVFRVIEDEQDELIESILEVPWLDSTMTHTP